MKKKESKVFEANQLQSTLYTFSKKWLDLEWKVVDEKKPKSAFLFFYFTFIMFH